MMEEKENERTESPVGEGIFPDPVVKLKSVLQLLSDWEQDYFVPVSWPSHTRDHVFHALSVLRERIRGLSS